MADKPLVLITGAAGDLGSRIARVLSRDYRLVGLERPGKTASMPLLHADIADQGSVEQALAQLRERHGARIASVIHLAAYFDFTGDENPLYDKVNVQGTRTLLRALQSLEVEQFVYAGTMLVHEPCKPGERIDEQRPLAPKWAYPKSKAAAEAVIRDEHGRIPYLLLHLAGVYDERSCVPTLAQQIARIYERDFTSHLYSGDPAAGQSMLHKEDMADAFRRAVDRRAELQPGETILIGEPEAIGYDTLQDRIGRLVHGDDEWTTLRLPKPAARLGAAVQEQLEPLVPDAIDQGKKPFIRPFMVDMADDHYALDITKARRLLGWEPRHRLDDVLPQLVQALKHNPPGWYRDNGVTPPAWLSAAAKQGVSNADELRRRHESSYRGQHAQHLWAPFANIALATWLLTAAPLLGLQSGALAWSDRLAGLALLVCATLALSWRLVWARWACAAIGLWVMGAPLLFWAPTAAGYLNDTLVGALVVGLAIALPPEPGVSPLAATSGPDAPRGWSYNPSGWTQRLPIILLALVGLHISRYLAAYQLGHIDSVWEPFFAGGPDPRNGTEEVITSSVSQAWPVPDAGVGALTYLLEILTGAIGSRRRWRTMPWLVLLFGLMIVPLGVVSIFFIVIQPIWIGTWCTLCLIAAAAMLVQIPYSIDEIVATCQFMRRRRQAGASLLAVLLWGDTDDGHGHAAAPREFERPAGAVLRDMWIGGVGLNWSLTLTLVIGAALMGSRLWLGAEGLLAHAHHLAGALAITVVAIASAEAARTARFVNVPIGAALLASAWLIEAPVAARWATALAALALIALSMPRGPVRGRYAGWTPRIV
jgi:nucleoside-diphosphate-sugar epimerase